MKSALCLSAIILFGGSPTPSIAQDKDDAVEEITNVCRQVLVGNMNGFNALSNNEESRSGIAMLCTMYLQGYKEASSSISNIDHRLPATCRSVLQVAIKGGSAENALASALNQMEMSDLDRLNAINLCDYFKNGFSAGMQYSRDIVN